VTSAAERHDAPGVVDAVGLVCARAAIVALGGGLVEGFAISRALDAPSSGLAFANAGLWFPLGLLALLPARASVSVLEAPERRARYLALGGALLFLAAVAGLVGQRLGIGAIRWAPLELLAAFELAVVASAIRPEPPVRRAVAVAGIVLAFGMQLFATRWIEVHRAFAGAMTDLAWIPRVMLKWALRRIA
jgi:hypothetical protein